jgi:hypothetical protein
MKEVYALLSMLSVVIVGDLGAFLVMVIRSL